MGMDVDMGTKQIQMMKYWTWSELLVASRQCQSFGRKEEEEEDIMFDKVMDSVVSRIASTNEINPSNSSYSSSPENSGVRYSFETRSNASTKNNSSFSCCFSASSSSSSSNCQKAWWFEDLMFLRPDVLKKMVVKMKQQPQLDHATICRFLLYYLKNKPCSSSGTEEKRIILEAVIDLLYSLDRTTVSCRTLFAILRMSLSMNLTQPSAAKLDGIVGSQIDRATLDNILLPAPIGGGVYDVGLVLRLCKSFLIQIGVAAGSSSSRRKLKTVGSLIDLYLAEVAPDPLLKPQKFVSLAMLLPDDARDSYDGVYRALDMYITVNRRNRIQLQQSSKFKTTNQFFLFICFASGPYRFNRRTAIEDLLRPKLREIIDRNLQTPGAELVASLQNSHPSTVVSAIQAEESANNHHQQKPVCERKKLFSRRR